MTTKKEDAEAVQSVDKGPDVRKDKVVSGAHDLSDHPAVKAGVLRNVGDSIIGRDESAPTFRRMIPGEATQEQSEGTRETTTSDPAKKTVKATGKGDGAGPES